MKVQLHIANVTNVKKKTKKKIGMRITVGVSPTLTTLGRLFRAAAFIQMRLMRNLEKVQLLFECGFYTQLKVVRDNFGSNKMCQFFLSKPVVYGTSSLKMK